LVISDGRVTETAKAQPPSNEEKSVEKLEVKKHDEEAKKEVTYKECYYDQAVVKFNMNL
jgi:hypothetical protein